MPSAFNLSLLPATDELTHGATQIGVCSYLGNDIHCKRVVPSVSNGTECMFDGNRGPGLGAGRACCATLRRPQHATADYAVQPYRHRIALC